MAMPNNLVFVRHGESEGNHAIRMKRNKGIDLFTPEFLARHESTWRLTDRGIWQAEIAGRWIKENIGLDFFRFYTSSFFRALETAFYLAFPNAGWWIHPYLHERLYGLISSTHWDEADEIFKLDFLLRDKNKWFWQPPRGQSLDFLQFRVDRGVFDTLHRECERTDVLLACHGEVMTVADAAMRRMNPFDCNLLLGSKCEFDKIHNAQVVHYSRINPETKEIESHLNWKRSVCPWDLSLSKNEWERIERPVFKNEDLLKIFSQTPRIINNPI